jgi:hypothetical protein
MQSISQLSHSSHAIDQPCSQMPDQAMQSISQPDQAMQMADLFAIL